MFNRYLQATLGRHRSLYLRLLELTGRGSLEKRLYLALLRRGDVLFDVGANHGYFTLLFSDVVGAEGEVHAFEPIPSNFAILRDSVTRHGQYPNTILNQMGCSDGNGKTVMHMPNGDGMQASLARHESGSWTPGRGVESFEVETVALDEYAAGASRERLDFVKCDVEGAELLVLRGMRERLTRQRPLLFLEAFDDWSRNFGYSTAELVSYVREVGYDRIYVLTDQLVELDPDGWKEGERRCVNILCATESLHRERLRSLERMTSKP